MARWWRRWTIAHAVVSGAMASSKLARVARLCNAFQWLVVALRGCAGELAERRRAEFHYFMRLVPGAFRKWLADLDWNLHLQVC